MNNEVLYNAAYAERYAHDAQASLSWDSTDETSQRQALVYALLANTYATIALIQQEAQK